MKRRLTAINIWREMSLPALVRLSIAAFLLFGALGLVSILIESSIRVFPWGFVIVQVISAGGLAASIVLLGRRRWWITVLLAVFWNAVMVFNGGGISFVVSQNEGFRVRLSGPDSPHVSKQARLSNTVLTTAQLDDVYFQRGVTGVAIIVFLVGGYVMFLSVIRGEVKRRAHLETEVRIAQEIQQSLLPTVPFESGSCQIHGVMLPAGEVGGDYFDIIPLPDGKIAVAIADVTGHGVGAGILSAMTKSALHLQLERESDPDEVLSHLNSVIYEVSDKKTFVTFAYALIDPASCSVQVATAGHPPVLHRKTSTRAVTPIRSKNMALGMRPDSSFAGAATLNYEPGDFLLLYTDGLLEVTNSAGQQFGERLPALLERVEGTPGSVLNGLLDDLRSFAGNRVGFEDDVSLVCVRINGGSAS
jgi:serine phosphatase RsbU (regulator of sigma subunit)